MEDSVGHTRRGMSLVLRRGLEIMHFGSAWMGWLICHPATMGTLLRRAFVVWRASGAVGLWHAVMYKATGRQTAYQAERWYRASRPKARTLNRMRGHAWRDKARLFVVVADLRTASEPQWVELLCSMNVQVYERWRLVAVVAPGWQGEAQRLAREVAVAPERVVVVASLQWNDLLTRIDETGPRGDAICWVEKDTTLEATALYRLAEVLQHETVDVAYGDGVVCDARSGRVESVLARPRFSYQYLLETGYIRGCVAIRFSTLAAALSGSCNEMPMEVLDVVLRSLEHARQVGHVASILTRTTFKGGAGRGEARGAMEAVDGHLRRVGAGSLVATQKTRVGRDVTWNSGGAVRVGIVVATKNAAGLVRQCVESLERTVPPGLAQLIIVDHASDEWETIAYLRSLAGCCRVIRRVGPFNFSRLMNEGVAAALPGEYTHWLFLNNDIEALEAGWLEHMLGLAARSQVGVVGATLVYPNRRVQHAGVIVGLRGLAGHFGLGLPAYGADGKRSAGYQGTLTASREVSAVTGACMLIRRELFEELGGFDEAMAVGYGDVDLCLRARVAGYEVVNDGCAVLLHHESYTRGKTAWDPHPEDTRLFYQRYARQIAEGDPYYSPHLSRVLTQFQLESPRREKLEAVVRTSDVRLPRGGLRDAIWPHRPGRARRPAA